MPQHTHPITFVRYEDLSNATKVHLDKVRDFISDVDGKTIATECGENEFIDEGTIDADDAVIAFNAIVALSRNGRAPA